MVIMVTVSETDAISSFQICPNTVLAFDRIIRFWKPFVDIGPKPRKNKSVVIKLDIFAVDHISGSKYPFDHRACRYKIETGKLAYGVAVIDIKQNEPKHSLCRSLHFKLRSDPYGYTQPLLCC